MADGGGTRDECGRNVSQRPPGGDEREATETPTELLPAISVGLGYRVVAKMRRDEVFEALRGDPLIMAFAADKYRKLRKNAANCSYIAGQLRELGELLLEVRRREPAVRCLGDCFRASRYPAVLGAVRRLHERTDSAFREDSHGWKYFLYLTLCANMLRGSTALLGEGRSEDVDEFVALIEKYWREGYSALEQTQNARRLERTEMLLRKRRARGGLNGRVPLRDL